MQQRGKSYCGDWRQYKRGLHDEPEGRDGKTRQFEVRSSRFSELRTPHFTLPIALVLGSYPRVMVPIILYNLVPHLVAGGVHEVTNRIVREDHSNWSDNYTVQITTDDEGEPGKIWMVFTRDDGGN